MNKVQLCDGSRNSVFCLFKKKNIYFPPSFQDKNHHQWKICFCCCPFWCKYRKWALYLWAVHLVNLLCKVQVLRPWIHLALYTPSSLLTVFLNTELVSPFSSIVIIHVGCGMIWSSALLCCKDSQQLVVPGLLRWLPIMLPCIPWPLLPICLFLLVP